MKFSLNEKTATRKPRPFSNPELAAFCGQLGLILHSGISSAEGLSLLMEDSTSPEEQRILKGLISDLEESGSLFHALSSTGLFPPYLLSMIEIGEETGTLDEVLHALSLHYEREDLMRRNLKSALTYPLIMAAMLIAVIVILLVKVMPVFQQVFLQLGTEMTGFSRILMQMGTALNRYAVVFSVILLLALFCMLLCCRTSRGRLLAYRLGRHISGIRFFQEQMAACRFAGGMAVALKSGLTQEQSLDLASRLVEDEVFASRLANCKKNLLEGESLAEAMHREALFSGVYARMVSIGVRTGELDQVMEQIADLSREELEDRTGQALAILEPTLVIVLSLIVGGILLSVMLPLMGIMSSL